jgi:hypothetical protein
LGPLLFSLTISPIIQLIDQKCPDLDLHFWFLDDGNIIGSSEDFLRAFNIVVNEGAKIELKLNTSRCELWSPAHSLDHFACLPAEIRRLPPSGVEMFGCPVGTAEYVNQYINCKVDKITLTLKLLSS